MDSNFDFLNNVEDILNINFEDFIIPQTKDFPWKYNGAVFNKAKGELFFSIRDALGFKNFQVLGGRSMGVMTRLTDGDDGGVGGHLTVSLDLPREDVYISLIKVSEGISSYAVRSATSDLFNGNFKFRENTGLGGSQTFFFRSGIGDSARRIKTIDFLGARVFLTRISGANSR